MIKWLILSLLLANGAFAATDEAAKVEAEFDSLSGNKIFLEKAQALQPEQNVSIVQNRTVPLDSRVEIAPEFAGTFGGDAFTRSKNIGLNAVYHFNSRWAIGAKYSYSFNDLTPEGEAMMKSAIADYEKDTVHPTTAYPYLDYQKSETMALLNWSPIYGKLNLLDKAVAHFDFYLVGGYGQVELLSGPTPTYTGGGGLAFWLTQKFSTRVEMRYQNYKAKSFSEDKNMDLAIASVQMGWLL